jgi:tryptophanyl-tRNA synthetase
VRKRILTGDRPTGRMHLGHYVGSIQNRVQLQQEYETYLLVADLHMLTTRNTKEDIDAISGNARGMVLDLIAAGVDPETVTIYLQSAVPEVYELNLICEMLVTVPRLSRLPSLKDMARAAHLTEMPFGLLGYPVLQAADILLPRAHVVPVGKDNASHVEITREIARRFNRLYGDVFPVPEALVGEVATLVGTDGQAKMSSSLGNDILLCDDEATVNKKVQGMYTDPKRVHAHIPGTVEGNPVFTFHDAFNDDATEVADLKERYEKGAVGDKEVKEKLAAALNRYLAPMRERYARYGSETGLLDQILVEGTEKMRETAGATMKEVRTAMGISTSWKRFRRAAERRAKKNKGRAP